MRHRISIIVIAAAAACMLATGASAKGVSPAKLSRAGWNCFLPPPFNPKVHCAPPGQLEAIVSGPDGRATFLVFDTDM